jgi:hypothetical protein
LKNILAGLLVLICGSAQADIIDLGNVTRDTSTGLDWLDLTETIGQTSESIAGSIAVNGDRAGYRFATSAEVQLLWQNLALTDQNNTPQLNSLSDYFAAVDTFNLLGNTLASSSFNGSSLGSIGFIADECSLNQGGTLIVSNCASGYYLSEESLGGSLLLSIESFDTADVGSAINSSEDFVGSYLVAASPSPIPVPAALWLFVSATLGLVGIKRKK